MLIYAHRGASRDFPEHTQAAYRAAVDQGADGFECDVRLTRDGVPILWHDADDVASTSYADLLQRYPDLMTLDDFLEIAIKSRKAVAIETKHPVPSANAVEDAVLAALQKHNAAAKIDISLMSFSLLAISYLKRRCGYTLVQLIRDSELWFKSAIATPQVFAPSMKALRKNPDFVAKAHHKGKAVYVWTVDDSYDQKMCAELGVDVMITNTPGQARRTLGYS